MKKTLLIILVLGLLMFKSLLNAFGMGGKAELPTMHPRQINLSGNIFTFKMPEDFSRDMPAEDLLEKLDLDSPKLKHESYVTLMQRWWDLKEPGFFGKEMGTVMMSISVRARPENQAQVLKVATYDFHEILHFIVALYDDLGQRYRSHNQEAQAAGSDDFVVYVPGLATQMGDLTYANYDVITKNERAWLFTGTAQERQLEKIFALPLTTECFLEIDFQLMPNDDVVAREFVNLAMERVNAISDTFVVRYADTNEFDKITANTWINKNLLDELKASKVQLFEDSDTPPLENF